MRRFDPIIKAALKEDVGQGDVTTALFIPANRRFEGLMFSKTEGILCGGSLARRVFELADPGARVRLLRRDGTVLKKGDPILRVGGSRRLLTAERTALNFIQHLSGIATRTDRFVRALKRSRTRIYDTRKTLPGLRALEKYAVKCGCGMNHRMGLYDAFLIKDNHIAMLEGSIEKLKERLARARAGHPGLEVEIEAQDLGQVKAFLPLGFDVIMLDNMSPAEMKKAISLIRAGSGRTAIEISGGVRFEDLPRLAGLGADRISVGSLTNSAASLDIAFDLKPAGRQRRRQETR